MTFQKLTAEAVSVGRDLPEFRPQRARDFRTDAELTKPFHPEPMPEAVLGELRGRLRALREDVEREGAARYAGWEPYLGRQGFRPSAQNLAHYLALRRHDLRDLQRDLMPLGLSSLGRSESRVLPTLDAVLARLGGGSAET